MMLECFTQITKCQSHICRPSVKLCDVYSQFQVKQPITGATRAEQIRMIYTLIIVSNKSVSMCRAVARQQGAAASPL